MFTIMYLCDGRGQESFQVHNTAQETHVDSFGIGI